MIEQLVTYAMGAVMVLAVVVEMRTGRIPNWLTVLPVALFALLAVVTPDRTTLLWQVGLGAAVFALGLVLFAFAGFGAGAVKLMGGVALFIPLHKAFLVLGVFVVTMFVSAFLIIQLRKAFGSQDSSWTVMAKAILPMSVPVCAAGLAALFVL